MPEWTCRHRRHIRVPVRDGIVAMPIATGEFGTLNESIRIGSVAYVHVRVGRRRNDEVIDPSRFVPSTTTGQMVGMRVKRGARFTGGETLGTVNRFNHVHLNVGWPGEEYNPLHFGLVQFADTSRRPSARRDSAVRREDEPPTPRGNRGG